jgi:hypothetical protein
MRLRTTLIALALLGTAHPATAQNASTPGALDLYPTFEAVGARLSATGDANANASAHLEWRTQGSGTWIRGMDMVRITNARWAGSVLWLHEDTAYEVRAVIDDPDGGGSTSGAVRTRVRLPATPSGTSYHVATTGNDAAAGTASAPFRTLTHAASLAQPGDAIHVAPGVYYETIDTPRPGTAAAPIHLIADGPGAILDGSDPAYLARSDWQSEGGGVYSVPYTGTTRLVCADSLQRLYHQATLSDLQAGANGVAQGWTVAGGRLYVRLEDGSTPAGHVIHVARLDYGIFLDTSYWRVSGFTTRYFGTSAAASGITLRGSVGCEVLDNTVLACAGRPIFLRVMAADNLVEGNDVVDPRVATWPWAAVKSHDEEGAGILNRGGRGNVLRNNLVTGTFDGLAAGGDLTSEDVASDADFSGNQVQGVGDDGIETDDFSAINTRVIGNRFDGTTNEISIAPISQGPEIVAFNVFANPAKGGVKCSLSSSGQAWLVHNTFWCPPGAVHPTGNYSNLHFRDNLFMGTPPVNDDAGESLTGNDFDGDLLFSSSSTVFRWKGVNYTSLAALQSATGFELQGRVGDPSCADPAHGDFTLLPGSPAVDAGIRMPGYDDGFGGAAPDIGAFELGGVDTTPPAAITDLSAD